MNLIICIVICENNKGKITDIQNTWLKLILNKNIQYFFIIDNKYDFGEDKHFIYLPNLYTDTHFNILRNFKNDNYDFICITFIDSFINIDNLLILLEQYNYNDNIYIGGHGDYRVVNHIKFYFHSYTPGIILSKSATLLLLDFDIMTNYNNICLNNDLKNLSGVAIGYYSHIYNIKLIIDNNFHYCNWQGYPCHLNSVKLNSLICCSNMSKNDMYNYYNILFNKIINNKVDIINNKMEIIICPGGGFGNILFQYFYGYCINKKYNCPVYYQINYNYWRGDINQYKMLKHLNFIDFNTDNISQFIDYNEGDFLYKPILFEQNKYKISGYFQSFKYSEEYINDIRNELFLNISSEYFSIEQKYLSFKNNKNTCLIHVRHGDYLQLQNIHPICNDEYYINAIKLIPDCRYLICSDDNNFVTNWNILKGLDYIIVDLIDPEELLIFMSFCDNFIIANSTLSLAGYLLRLNKNAKLIAPKKWFGQVNYKFSINDIIPSDGIIL